MRKAILFGVVAVLLTMTQPARAQFCPGVSPWVFDDVQASTNDGCRTSIACRGLRAGLNTRDARVLSLLSCRRATAVAASVSKGSIAKNSSKRSRS